MAITPYEVRVGPGRVYVAPTGTAFPLVGAAPAAAWIDLGRTEGGVTIRHTKETEAITVDQAMLPVKEVVTAKRLEIEFALAEITVERYAKLLEDATITTTAAGTGVPGTKKVTLFGNDSHKQFAMLVRVPSGSFDGDSQYELKNVVRGSGDMEMAFKKGEKTVIPTTWVALEDSANPGQFGTYVEYTAAAL